MTGALFNLLTLIVAGVILADMIIHSSGTTAFFNGVGGLWGTSINGLLGKTS
jgi:hypothetical protein